MQDLFKSRDVLKVGKKQYVIFRLDALEKAGLTKLSKLPYSIRVVLEAALRTCATVAEAAARCGFDDPSYFTRWFRRQRGLAPRAWQATVARSRSPT
mgnify:CR=1 FL=1